MKGRRAADRRRERQRNHPVDDGRGITLPGVDPLPSERSNEAAAELDDVMDGDIEAVESVEDADGVEDADDADDADDPDDPDDSDDSDDSDDADDADDADDHNDLPLVSQVQELETGPAFEPTSKPPWEVEDDEGHAPHDAQGAPRVRTSTNPQRGPRPGASAENDPEASFVKALAADAGRREAGVVVTVVRDLPTIAPRRGGHLVVLTGPDAGAATDIEVTPSILGRAASAEIGLSDPCISRRHCELALRDDEQWVLQDLGSTSGTLVNGVVVNDDHALCHGDVISIGQTELRFLRSARLPVPRPAPVPVDAAPTDQPHLEPTERLSRRDLTGPTRATGAAASVAVRAQVRATATRIIAACAVVFVVVLVGRGVYQTFLADSAPAQIRAQVATLLADGRNRLRAQDVDGARSTAETVLALDHDNEEGKSLQRTALTEMDARAAIAFALQLGDEERDIEALQILRRVPDSSVFAPTRDRLRRNLADRVTQQSRRAIEALIDQGKLDEARAAAEKHVAEWPDDGFGRALLDRLVATRDGLGGGPALAAARDAFRGGDLARARRIATDAKLTGFARSLNEFVVALENGKRSLQRFDDEAAQSLDTAFRLLGPLGATPSSPIFSEVRKPYANALYLAGVGKLEKDGCAGARLIFRAARIMPEDQKIQQKLRELDDRAVAGLDLARGGRSEDPERAAAVAREHLCFANLGSRTWNELKALSRL